MNFLNPSNLFESLLATKRTDVVHISLDNEKRTFTNNQELQGKVTIKAGHIKENCCPTIFFEGEFLILFLYIGYLTDYSTGVSQITTERILMGDGQKHPKRSTFLQLSQLAERASNSKSQETSVGDVDIFRFQFKIPQELPEGAHHFYRHHQIKAAHTQLPPSLKNLRILSDDLTSAWIDISYIIRVEYFDTDTNRSINLAKPICFMPMTNESPPIYVSRRHGTYQMESRVITSDTTIHGFSSFLSAKADQPEPLQFPGNAYAPATTVHVNMSFHSTSRHASPPQLQSISVSFHSITYFSEDPFTDFPDRSGGKGSSSNQLIQSLSYKASKTQWIPSSPSQCCCSNGMEKETHSFISTFLIPITIENVTNLVPTFHFCYLSRVYTICLIIRVSREEILLKVPVQLSYPNLNQNF